MTAADLPTGDGLLPHLDGYDDNLLTAYVRGLLDLDGYDENLLTAYVRGLLEHLDMRVTGVDPYQSTLPDFADVMAQDVILAAQGGNPSPLIHYAYRGILDVAKDAGSRLVRMASRRTTRTASGMRSSSLSARFWTPNTRTQPSKAPHSRNTAACTAS